MIVGFFVVGGIFLLVMGIWRDPIMERLGWGKPTELLTSERLRRSAQIEARWGQVVQILLGLAFMLHGLNMTSVANPVTTTAVWFLLALLIACILVVIVTKVFYWRA
jgi:hypothetical protein